MGTVPDSPLDSDRSAHTAPGEGSSSASVPSVSIEHLTVAYGSILAVDDADIAIAPGSIVAVIGPNGSGKSTLLSTISGLIAPTRGAVKVHGRPPKQGRRRVAHVLQTTIANEAVPLTVLETVRMGCYAHTGVFRRLTASDRKAVNDAVERMRIGDLLGRQLHELSGGQRQRTYVAQGLAQRADVLLLDEPITGLDLVTQETITEVMQDERAEGRTVVFTTHDVGTARLADQAILIATAIVAEGDPAKVLSPRNLAMAYGGHLHVLEDGTIVLDEPHRHGSEHPQH